MQPTCQPQISSLSSVWSEHHCTPGCGAADRLEACSKEATEGHVHHSCRGERLRQGCGHHRRQQGPWVCTKPSLAASAEAVSSAMSPNLWACRFALAREFLAAGDAVVLCSRSEEQMRDACTVLRDERPSSEVCHMTHASLPTVLHAHQERLCPCSGPHACMHHGAQR